MERATEGLERRIRSTASRSWIASKKNRSTSTPRPVCSTTRTSPRHGPGRSPSPSAKPSPSNNTAYSSPTPPPSRPSRETPDSSRPPWRGRHCPTPCGPRRTSSGSSSAGRRTPPLSSSRTRRASASTATRCITIDPRHGRRRTRRTGRGSRSWDVVPLGPLSVRPIFPRGARCPQDCWRLSAAGPSVRSAPPPNTPPTRRNVGPLLRLPRPRPVAAYVSLPWVAPLSCGTPSARGRRPGTRS
mmetsp:Transcript_8874/g.18183  ORF Transcript_8874/g.18183 Transcript_8874/m.18183 type:complete len:243 (-) Transcript_8874:199-927(-)